jgi:hypothetical protein
VEIACNKFSSRNLGYHSAGENVFHHCELDTTSISVNALFIKQRNDKDGKNNLNRQCVLHMIKLAYVKRSADTD